MNISKEKLALIFIYLLAGGLCLLGIHMASLSAISLFRQWPYYLLPEPKTLWFLAVLLVWLRNKAASYLLWIAAKLHRTISLLLLVAALGADGLLHIFSIPHMEGWWVSLIGSSAALSAVHIWIQKQRGRHHE